MANWNNLSYETVIAILDYTPRNEATFSILMSVSRRFHPWVEPLMYEKVSYISRHGFIGGVFGDEGFYHTWIAPRFTKIYRLDQFLTTLHERSVLRSFVKVADFRAEATYDFSDEYRLFMQVAEQFDSVRRLHITPSNQLVVLSQPLCITSVNISYEGIKIYPYGNLYAIFSMSTIRRVCVLGIDDWNQSSHETDELKRLSASRKGTSNIQHLALISKGMCGLDTYSEILRWPIALESLSIRSNGKDPEGDSSEWDGFDNSAWATGALSQAQSLQTLDICIQECLPPVCASPAKATVGSLRAFICLQQVALDWNLLYVGSEKIETSL